MRRYSVKEISKLEKRSFRDQEGVFVVEGKKILSEALRAGAQLVQVLATEKFAGSNREFLQELRLPQGSLTIISEYNASRLAATETPSGLLAIVQKMTVNLEDALNHDRIAIFENVRDPGNLGTMLRTADWFGVKSVIISHEGVDMYNDKVLRATMGSLFHVSIYVSQNLVSDVQKIKTAGFSIMVTRPEAKTTLPSPAPKKLAMIIGNESLGTSSEIDTLADFTYAIPKFGQAESLNVAISFGIILYELTR